MLITNAKLGQDYYLYQDTNYMLSKLPTALPTVTATLIGIDNYNQVTKYLFGWLDVHHAIPDQTESMWIPGTTKPSHGNAVFAMSHAECRRVWSVSQFVQDFERYAAFIWVPQHCQVGGYCTRVASVQAKPIPACVCMRCNASNPWAAPNRPNGKYICFECR